MFQLHLYLFQSIIVKKNHPQIYVWRPFLKVLYRYFKENIVIQYSKRNDTCPNIPWVLNLLDLIVISMNT